MSKIDNTYDLISAYLNNSLSVEDRAMFERKIEQDANFKQYFENHKLANILIVKGELIAIKQTLVSIHKKEKVKKLIFKTIAILVLLLGLIGVFLYLFGGEVEAKKVVEKKKIKENKSILKTKFIKVESQETKENFEHIIVNVESKTIPPILDTVLVEDSVLDLSVDIVLESVKEDTIKKIFQKKLMSNTEKKIRKDTLSKTENKKCEERFWVSFEIGKIMPTIKTEHNGSFEFELLEDDYSYSISNGEFVEKTNKFEGLKVGTYNLIAIDSEGCKSFAQEVEIPMLETDFIIYPNQGQFWNIPLESFDDQEKIKVTIYSAKSGVLVYNLDLDSWQDNSWQGKTVGGQSLPMGNYVYELKSINKVVRGNITIIK